MASIRSSIWFCAVMTGCSMTVVSSSRRVFVIRRFDGRPVVYGGKDTLYMEICESPIWEVWIHIRCG